MSGLVRLWRLLTEAPAPVTDPERRRQLRFLSGLLVVLIPLGLLSVSVQLLMIPGFWPTFAAVASALAVLLAAYGLARSGRFTAGAVVTVCAAVMASFAIVLLNAHDLFVYAFLLIAILLASLLFSEVGTWITALGVLLGASVLLPAWGVPPPDNDPLVVPIFIVIVTALLLLGIRHRNALERDRQAELAASEARFRGFSDATLEGVVFTENGRIVDINERGAALVGAARSTTLIGRDILDFCAPADRERVATQMRNNVTTPYKFAIRRLDGSEFPGVVRGRTSLYHDRPVRVTVFRDLTEILRAEEELRHEREFTSTVFDAAGNLIVVLDRSGRIVRFNRTAEQLTGYRFDEVRGKSPWDYFLPPEEAAAVEAVFKRLTANDVVARYENHWRMRDGSLRLFDWSNRVLTDSAGNVEYIVTVGSDITERKRVEQRTQQLNRLLQTLGSINPALLGASTEPQLFANICRTLVEQGGFAMAWVGLAEPDTQRVRVACQSGFAHGYLENLDIRYDDSPSGQGPTGTSIRTGRTVINEDTETNPLFAAWRERARQHGYRSTVAIPLRVHEQVVGSLNVYAALPHAFGDEEVVLLEKLTGDVGMAVERLRAIERIAASEHELATILNNMQDTYYRTDLDGRIVRASESATQLLGYAPQEVLGMRLGDFYVDADGREKFVAALKAASGTLRNYEAPLRHRDGQSIWVSTNAQYVRGADGKIIGIEGTTRDITERKRAEVRLLDIARGVVATTGETYFHSLVAHLVQSLQADYAFVGQLLPDQVDRIRTIAVQFSEQRADDFEYDLAGTPCQNVVGRETCAYPQGVQEQFPNDHLLVTMGVHAYVGTPLFGSNGVALGLLVVLYRRPIDDDLGVRSTLEIFAARAAAELERLHAEQALRESEIMLARAQEMTHLGSWKWQVATGHVTWSDEMYRIYGVSPDTGEVSFERAMAAIHPDDRALVTQQVQAMLAGKDTENYECRIVRPDGVERIVWARSEVQRAADGSPLFVLGTVQDITDHKRAEQALRDSESRYRTIVETAQEGIWQIDADNRTSFVNRKMADILGYSIEEMNGRQLFDFMDEEGQAIAVQNVERRKAGIAEQHNFRFRRKDGVVVWAELNTSPLYDAHGSYIGALAMVTDITERTRAEQTLRESEAKYRHLFENMTSGFALHEIICDAEGKPVDYRYLQANPAFEKLTGVPIATLVGRRIKEILPDTEDYWIQIFGKVALSGEPMAYENFSRELGKYYDTWVFSPQKNQFAVIFTDITQRKVAEAEMVKLSSALEQSADVVVITDRQGIIEYVNQGFEKTTGYTRAESVGQTPRLVKSNKQGAGFYKKLWDTILAGEVFSEVFVNRRKDGSLYYEEKTISPLKDATGSITHFVSTGKDVSERMQAQERMQHMAQHDALTELPNRMLFLDRLKQALARARWHERLVAVLFVDLDRFKTINDTLGHEVGDRLLQSLAGRFSTSVREGDTVARFGGDEFVILIDDVATEKDVGAVAQKVLESISPPFAIDGQDLYVTASIGVSLYPNDGEESGTLLKNADIAMYRAKEIGKNTYQFYSSDMSARAFERLTLESSLRHAIERNEFRLYYQPQIDTTSGAILGVEALVRWQHPDFGLVAPAEFIPLLEETGLIVPVGDWVLHSACAQLRTWHAAGWPQLRMAVNLSPRQFQNAGLAETVERVLSTLGGGPALLELEITESVLLRHTATTLETLEALHAFGARLAIDDFGTGYSSLSYLRRYSIDTLKIDRSFVRDVPGDADDSALASAIIVLAQSLKLDVIAEGVETEAQRDFLRARGCHQMQGYLFSRPLPAEDITRLLAAQIPTG